MTKKYCKFVPHYQHETKENNNDRNNDKLIDFDRFWKTYLSFSVFIYSHRFVTWQCENIVWPECEDFSKNNKN